MQLRLGDLYGPMPDCSCMSKNGVHSLVGDRLHCAGKVLLHLGEQAKTAEWTGVGEDRGIKSAQGRRRERGGRGRREALRMGEGQEKGGEKKGEQP